MIIYIYAKFKQKFTKCIWYIKKSTKYSNTIYYIFEEQ